MNKFSQRLAQVAAQPSVFTQLNRGVERESLRYTTDGELSKQPHPQTLGSAMTHERITTDYAESLLEFITPVSQSIDTLVDQLSDTHHFTQKNLGEEALWPLSMPCFIKNEDDIVLAQYGSSNAGRMKTLYREGLKNRYGSLMQVISGVHFNFSFPDSFWDAVLDGEQERQAQISDAYFGLIRNYYRFGWLIPFFFGASPALCPSFIQGRETKLPFENIGQTLFLPKATSLRLSDLGYTNSAQSELKIGFNSLEQYLNGLNAAIKTPSAEFAQIGVKVDGDYKQLNSNVLQIENELYAPIRPKRVTENDEKPSQALSRGGVQYIEVRSLDVNPFSPIGITKQQIRFLDLFLTWAVLSDSDPMDNCELECWRENWEKVILSGRERGLELQIGCSGEKLSLQAWAHKVFDDLRQVAEVMDAAHGGNEYQTVCEQLQQWIDNPELTISGQLLEHLKQHEGLIGSGNVLGQAYKQHHLAHEYQTYSEQSFVEETQSSLAKQAQLDSAEEAPFAQFLADYFAYMKEA
ncbi:glutamate--cysteine ligase [Vibrio sp. SCSIO 43136]|uniref:glutamate--cysteine ligase n=1 Tax=Vibrio sp. SCSIO 43136 TaxID=2819101 RepID=UPI0020754090|nr:glutamate--cysteine ligase [Vibrio sp. SCSIO 43136]USD65694.1 glutamate--cysteine ligase [Vibrio sp. SCSIO 43136]